MACVRDQADLSPDMTEVWREVYREEAKAYCRAVLRLAKKVDDYAECPGMTEAMVNRMHRAREIENVFAAEARDRNEGKATDRWFVTFNPSKDFDPNVLWTVVTGYLKKNYGKAIVAYYAVIEQRAEDADEAPHGWHIHVCVQFREELSRSVLLQRLKATASRFWSDDQMRRPEYKRNWLTCIHLQDYHRKYVEGEKREEKMAKVRVDKIFRERYGFPDFASSPENIFPGSDIDHGGPQVFSQTEEALCPLGEE